MMRAVVTTIYMIFITFIACLIPFFGCAPAHGGGASRLMPARHL